MTGTPAAEVSIDEVLVQRLLAEQHPDLAHLRLRVVGEGWDNAIFRLGDQFAVRLPRRGASADLIDREQHWLPLLSGRLPLPIPAPVRVGKPSQGYPWGWTVVPWLKGVAADESEPCSSQAPVLAEFLRSLHVPAPADAPVNPFRGVPLRERDASVRTRMERIAARTDLLMAQISHIWDQAVAAPMDGISTWLHGDLHPRNVLVDGGAISGIIDWGDLCAGDAATDLAACWMLFSDPASRQDFWRAYGQVSEPTSQRARGWALFFGLLLLDSGLIDNPRNAALGERILRQLC